MHPDIEKLCAISQKPKRVIIGLMSGTSLDGLDVACCTFTGNGNNVQVHTDFFTSIPYSKTQKEKLRKVCSRENILLKDLCDINSWLAELHAQMVNDLLKKWNLNAEDIDLIASHGQTIYHLPKNSIQNESGQNSTLQIGDGDHLALRTGIISISDFRQKHVAAGGEGAPLAKYADHLLFGKKGENRILLNIGGIANISFIPGSGKAEEILCTDTGPGNLLMDAWIQKLQPEKTFDKEGEFAATGKVNEALLSNLMGESFVQFPLPKTTGAELFNLQFIQNKLQDSQGIPDNDVMKTLCEYSVLNICNCIKNVFPNPCNVFISGGGIHNKFLIKMLQDSLPEYSLNDISILGIDPDAKEAVLFALLANEMVTGNKAFAEVSLGKISLPS